MLLFALAFLFCLSLYRLSQLIIFTFHAVDIAALKPKVYIISVLKLTWVYTTELIPSQTNSGSTFALISSGSSSKQVLIIK